jgi:hypothetical protein
LNGAKVAAKSSTEEEFTVAASGKVASVVGARSYANPTALINNGLVLVDAVRVSSAATTAKNVNVELGPDAAEGVAVSTYLTNLRIMRKKVADEVNNNFHVRVAYEDDSADNLDKVYNVKPTWSETTPVSDSLQADITHSALETALGLTAGKKFMEASLKVSVIASTGSEMTSSTRQSAPVTVSYSAKSVPALAASDFVVERLPSTLRVSLKDLTADKLGGFATLPVKIRATNSGNLKIVYGNTQNDILTLGSALTMDFGAMVSGSYSVVCEILDIEGEDFKVAKTITVGTFTPGSALVAAKKFKVGRSLTSSTSVEASWEDADLNGWTQSTQTLYVTGEDAAGKTIWYYQPADNLGTTTENESLTSALLTSYVETAHGATATKAGTIINRLPTGQKITVTLQTTFTKKDAQNNDIETAQIVRVSDYDVPSVAPEFKALTWDANNGILTALVATNGSAIKQFMLLARYAVGKPLGKVLMNVSLDGIDSIDAAPGSLVRYLVAFDLTKPIPDGILAILMNENGVDVHAHPATTFGGAAVSPVTAYNADLHKTFKTSAN